MADEIENMVETKRDIADRFIDNIMSDDSMGFMFIVMKQGDTTRDFRYIMEYSHIIDLPMMIMTAKRHLDESITKRDPDDDE